MLHKTNNNKRMKIYTKRKDSKAKEKSITIPELLFLHNELTASPFSIYSTTREYIHEYLTELAESPRLYYLHSWMRIVFSLSQKNDRPSFSRTHTHTRAENTRSILFLSLSHVYELLNVL